VLKNEKIETNILKSILTKKDGQELSLNNLKQLISRLVAEELKRYEPKMQRIKATSQNIKPLKS
jgi:hypothetical protein